MNEQQRIERQLQKLEQACCGLQTTASKRVELFGEVTEAIEAFMEKQTTMPAYTEADGKTMSGLDYELPENASSLSELLKVYFRSVAHSGANTSIGRFFGFIPGNGLYSGALGDYVGAVTNPYAGITYGSPGAVHMERALIRWIAEFIGYPETALGDLTSGGSIATLSALVTARSACKLRLQDIDKTVVYITPHTHHCLRKGLQIAGLSECVLREVELSQDLCMDPRSLIRQIKLDRMSGYSPWMVVATAGTANTGKIDPLGEIADIAEEYELWFHVDGAYGAAFALTPNGKAVLKGIERSDSLVIDPHKSLFLPYGSGAVLIRDGQKLRSAYSVTGDYVQDTLTCEASAISLANTSPELSRHFRGLRMWLPLRLAGVAAFRSALEEKMLLARYAYNEIGKIDCIELGPPPDLSIFTFRFVSRYGSSDETNRRLLELIREDGRIFISSTRVSGKFVLRLAILNVQSHKAEVDLAIQVLNEMATKVDIVSKEATRI